MSFDFWLLFLFDIFNLTLKSVLPLFIFIFSLLYKESWEFSEKVYLLFSTLFLLIIFLFLILIFLPFLINLSFTIFLLLSSSFFSY